MPVTTSDFLWEATGHSSSGTSVVVTHPDAGGTTAGTTVFVALPWAGSGTLTLPTGWTRVGSSLAPINIAFKSNVTAGETSWTFTLSASGSAAWYFAEIDNLNLEDPLDVATATLASATSNGGTRTITASAQNSSSSGVVLAFMSAVKVGTTDVQSWSGWTNSFTETFDSAPASGTAGRQIAVARRFTENEWTTWGPTATFATSVASASTAGAAIYLRSKDASINAPVTDFTGFEFGTAGGMGYTPIGLGPATPQGANNPAQGTFGTGYQVLSTSARGSDYGLKITATGSATAVAIGVGSTNTCALGMDMMVESATGQAMVASLVNSGLDLYVYYDAGTSKYGVGWQGGTVSWQTGTTSLGTWIWFDLRMKANSATHHADWWIDGVSQTSPTDLTGQATGSSVEFSVGTVAVGVTVTAHYDNCVYTLAYAAGPLGVHVVKRLVPETTGATVSGTATNFNKFTANGTLAAWAADAGALLDECPPTISASSDGVVQVNLAASDYMQFPMTTYTLASNEVIAGVRALAALWGGTGTGTGTLGFRGYDGTTETTFATASGSFDPDSLTTASATYPLWFASYWTGGASGKWNQTRLDAAALRLGFSTDATPDMGASALYLEVAIKAAATVRTLQTMTEAADFTADIVVDPYNSATVSYVVTNNDPTATATFNYSVSGVPQTPVTVAPGANTTVDIHADNFGDISDIALTEG